MLRQIALASVLASSAFLFAADDASAFCGFYVSGADGQLFNDATQVVLMREGTRTVLSMQNTYKGPPQDFALVVPVPVVLQKANVKTLKKALFEKLDHLSAPRLVEYWEQDPCAPEPPMEEMSAMAAPMGGAGPSPSVRKSDLGVKIEAQFTVGEYEIVILSAQDAAGLDTWLRREKYKIPSGAAPYLRPYVQAGSKFFVARVDTKKVQFDKEGRVDLSPLRFHYDTTELSLPVRLGLINSAGTQDLIVHVLAQGQRYEPANYPSVTIPTNLDLTSGAKDRFGAFYASLYDRTLAKHPKAIVTEYSWDASTCDPCPGPALDPSDIASLGADSLPGNRSESSGWVVTRLHARYSKDALGQDIVFRAAPPIAGGREAMGPNGQLENGSQSAPFNNFQGRYAIRHAWTGAIACAEPHRGRWGGPPDGNEPPPMAATRIAFAARGLPLEQLVARDVPEVDLVANAPAPSPVTPSVPAQQPKGGCAGCTIPSGGADASLAGAFLSALAGIAALWRRRRQRA